MEKSPENLSRNLIRNMSDEEFNEYSERHMETIKNTDYLKCKFGICGTCENCVEARALECYTDTPYVHRENCQCGKNINKKLVEYRYGNENYEVKTITICDFCSNAYNIKNDLRNC